MPDSTLSLLPPECSDAPVGAGYKRLRLTVQGIMAAGNFALNLYLIPHYGWRGAAWSSLETDGGMAILMWLLQYVRRSQRWKFARCPRASRPRPVQ